MPAYRLDMVLLRYVFCRLSIFFACLFFSSFSAYFIFLSTLLFGFEYEYCIQNFIFGIWIKRIKALSERNAVHFFLTISSSVCDLSAAVPPAAVIQQVTDQAVIPDAK